MLGYRENRVEAAFPVTPSINISDVFGSDTFVILCRMVYVFKIFVLVYFLESKLFFFQDFFQEIFFSFSILSYLAIIRFFNAILCYLP